MINFEDIYIQQTLRDLAPKRADLLASCSTVNIGANGSVMGFEVRIPVCAEVYLMNEENSAILTVLVNVGSGDNTLYHRAWADNRPLNLKGKNKTELRESYKAASEYIDFLFDDMKREVMESLVEKLREAERKCHGE